MQGRGPIQVVDKLWGQEVWYANDAHYCLKRLYLSPGFTSSLHYHWNKWETFIVESGACWLQVGGGASDGNARKLLPGDWVQLAARVRHRFWNNDLYDCVILEVSTEHREDDVVRLEESRQLREGEL